MKNVLNLAVAAVAMIAAVPASATTITFNSTPVGTLSSYSEGGYTVAAQSGTTNGSGYGSPGPSLYTPTSGTFNVTGGLFSVNGFDGGTGGGSGSQTFVLTGFLGGIQEFTNTYTRSGFGFTDFASLSANTIDRLNVTFSTTGTSANFDNLRLTAMTAAVPEPATWAMLILGMGAVGFAMRRRSKNVTTTVAYAA